MWAQQQNWLFWLTALLLWQQDVTQGLLFSLSKGHWNKRQKLVIFPEFLELSLAICTKSNLWQDKLNLDPYNSDLFLTFPVFPRPWCGAALWKWKATSLGCSMTSRSFLPSARTLWEAGAPPAGGEPSPSGSWEMRDPQTCTFRVLKETGQTSMGTTSTAMVGPRWPGGRPCGRITNPAWKGSLIPTGWWQKPCPWGPRSSRAPMAAVCSAPLGCSTCPLCQGRARRPWRAQKRAGFSTSPAPDPRGRAAPTPNHGRTAWRGGSCAACSPRPAPQTSRALPCRSR